MSISRTQAGWIGGAAFWAGMLVVLGTALRQAASGESTQPAPVRQLVDYALTRPMTFEANLPPDPVRRGDPIFFATEQGWVQTGYLDRIDSEDSTVRVLWYRTDIDPSLVRLEYYRNSGKLDDVLATLLPPEKRARIQARLSQALRDHGEEVTAAFRPVIEQSLRESAPVLEDALKASVQRHEEEFKQLGQRWEEDILKQRIVPLIRAEVLPTVREHGEPLAQEIGRELWDRASLWRFGWRALYDKSPFPEKDLLKEEWERFVEQDAIPVFESHMPEIVEAQKRIFMDVAENDRIRNEVEAVFKEMVDDEQFQDLVKAVVRESVIENRRLHAIWVNNLKSDQARAAMQLASKRLKPIVREIGDDLFGTKQAGVDPDFARVLRNQILGKDKRWIVAVPLERPEFIPQNSVEEARRTIHKGDGEAHFPLVMMAGEDPQE